MRNTLCAIVLAIVPAASLLAVPTTVTFQHGANGYLDGQDIRISMTASRDGTNGNNVNNYLIDGWRTDDPLTTEIEADSPDEQELIRFDNIFGGNAGQIPLGATILDSKLIYKTSAVPATGGNTPVSPGPWGVAALLQPFTTATRHDDFPSDNGNPLTPSRGPWFEDGYATRPTGAFGGLSAALGGPTGTRQNDSATEADVWPLIQRWSNGETNHGFAVQAGWTGQTDGWGFYTNGATTVDNRPKLSVTYTQSPIGITTFQRDLNSYTGDMVARLDSGGDINGSGDDVTIDGSVSSGAFFIDGATGSGGLFTGLMKFTNVFGAGANQAPEDKPVAKAWLVLTTGLNDDNRSPGPFSVHPMLREWDTNSLYTNFGATAGFQEADGDIGPVLDANFGATNGGESWFDITSYMEGVRNGEIDDNLGLALLPNTNDGWGIHLNGHSNAALRPRLVVYSDLSTTPEGLAGDYNDDGTVDAADYVVWRKSGLPLANETDEPGVNNQGDYNVWRSQFGESGLGSGGSAVPEPATWISALLALLATSFGSTRKRLG
jgi:hypothetical protein